jgi:VWFA-related protein
MIGHLVSARLSLLSIASIFTVLCHAQITPASQPTDKALAPPTLQAHANLVMVDVVVTHNGAPVTELTADKFHITEDGHPQNVVTFEEHRTTDAPVVSKFPALPPNVYSDFPEFSVSSAANVLLLDALNTPLSDQMYVRHQMLEYLKNVPPGTHIAVFTLASRLRLVEGFTTDSTIVASALSGKGVQQQSSMLDSTSGQQISDMSNSISSAGTAQNAISSMQQFQTDLQSFQTDVRVQITLDAMKQLARYLSVIPGRKNLVWFSGSFPLSISPDATLKSPFEATRNYADDVRQTDNMLSAAHVAVYPVDARGVMVLPSSSASKRFSSPTPSAASSGMSGGSRSNRGNSGHGSLGMSSSPGGKNSGSSRSGMSAASKADAKFLEQTAEEHASMNEIAEDTGGEAFVDTNGLKEAVAKAINNGSHYYSIGYIPTIAKYDGSFRHIQVNLDGGYQAAYRRGYYADDPTKAEVNSQLENGAIAAAVVHGAPQISQILFKVRVLPSDDPVVKSVKISQDPAGVMAKDLKGPVKRYLLDYLVDGSDFVFNNTPDGIRHARVEFAAIAYDSDGKRLNYTDFAARINLDAEKFAQIVSSGLPVHQEIDIPAQPIYLRIVVHDLDNGTIGATEVKIGTPRS